MALNSTCRSFAIYLVIGFIISESPVSGFAVRRRTTTSSSLRDLTGEESALLEVKSDFSKLHIERGDVKYGRDKPILRKSVNFLSPDKKFASTEKKTITTSTIVNPINKQEPLTPADKRLTSTTGLTETPTIMKTNSTTITTQANNAINKPVRNNNSTIEENDRQQIAPHNNTNNEIKTKSFENISKRTENVESTPFVTEEINTTISEMRTIEIPTEYSFDIISTTTVNENNHELTKKSDFVKKGSNFSKTTPEVVSMQTDSSKLESETMALVEIENTATYPTGLTESIRSSSSKASPKNSNWKKYTVIERKRPTTDIQHPSTEKIEELEKAESISSKITLNNSVNVTPIESLEELRQELISNPRTTTTKNTREVTHISTETTDILKQEIKQVPSTRPIVEDTTTIEAQVDFAPSKRGGYLDYSIKQTTGNEEVTTTARVDDRPEFNETQVIKSMTETETHELGPEAKNFKITESQSQLDEDAIKEELLKEKVLNDQVVSKKKYEGETNNVKPADTTDDEFLSVKPIVHGKGALYAVSSNYKKMKKIEVQPSKPFVRDPDDNSWRNESLTSLGIVFKAKNASKPFTQVLKNKTEAELNNVIQSEKYNVNEVPDLRQRLEKIAEVRKSKKKKIDKFGDTVYSDYEENSGEVSSTPKTNTIPVMVVAGEVFFEPTSASPAAKVTLHTTMPEETTTKKPKNKFPEYYDTTDEYDVDYLNLSKIDLKKFTTHLFELSEKTATTSPMLHLFTKPMSSMPERKPTVQYFPPRGSAMREPPMRASSMRDPPMREDQKQREPSLVPSKVSINDYDTEFQQKMNLYAQDKIPNDAAPATYATLPPVTVISERPLYNKPSSIIPADSAHPYEPANLDKSIYVTIPSRPADHGDRYPGSNDESFDRASYVIKHYKDLINEADRDREFMPAFTEPPLAGVTMTREKDKHMDDDYDYNANFRRDIINRFVDNFNQNNERFKVDFPILYNNTVVHMKADENGKVVASSSAFMKRLYPDSPGAMKPCDPHCDMKMDLAPAYELHYYVPDQEEREEAELRPVTLPFTYRL